MHGEPTKEPTHTKESTLKRAVMVLVQEKTEKLENLPLNKWEDTSLYNVATEN